MKIRTVPYLKTKEAAIVSLGSTVVMTDAAGKIMNQYAYDDFGQVAMNAIETMPNPFKYVGRWGVMTEALDLVYMRARHYVPSLGRFVQKDPLGFAGGDLNLYAYVRNNPINRIDPWGLRTGRVRVPNVLAEGLRNNILIYGGGGLVIVGLRFQLPPATIIGLGMIGVGVVSELAGVANLPDLGRDIAGQIIRETGAREHLRDIDEVLKEYDSTCSWR